MPLLGHSTRRSLDRASLRIDLADSAKPWLAWLGATALAGVMTLSSQEALAGVQAVSYTHLTLPTKA